MIETVFSVMFNGVNPNCMGIKHLQQEKKEVREKRKKRGRLHARTFWPEHACQPTNIVNCFCPLIGLKIGRQWSRTVLERVFGHT